MKSPSLWFKELHSEEYRFDKYWDKLKQTDVPTPDTKIIKLKTKNPTNIDEVEVPTSEIKEFMMENNYNQAFIKSGYKAAVNRFQDGSIILTRSENEIEKTFMSLVKQHIFNEIDFGNILVLREKLDLDYCMVKSHSHTPEIRYFIEDGAIIAKTPNRDEYNLIPECPRKYDFIESRFKDLNISLPDNYAKRVANEFKDSKYPWSIDFVLDNKGNWWATEMHINSVYYNQEKQDWLNVCGHGDAIAYSPRWIHSAALYNVTPNNKSKKDI